MKAKRETGLIGLLILVTLTVGGWLSSTVGLGRGQDIYADVRRGIGLFGRVYEEVAQRYVEPIAVDKFVQRGIEAMLEALDPYTVLVEKEDSAELQIMTQGKYGGVGMRIGLRNGWPTVVEPPFEGTPALRAGIREGDQIIEVDGVSTKGLSVSETAARLRGPKGTPVTIKILRPGVEDPLEFRLIRDEIHPKDVTYAGLVTDGVGLIKLSRFSRNAGQEVREAIQQLQGQGARALILDLRNNPGGMLEAAVEVAENFVPKGELIVSTRGRVKEANQEFRSQANPVWTGKPLAILVNRYSASASEIVAGCIQDLDLGVIIGSPTYGKGLVQTVVPIDRETAVKITTAKYYIPSGRLIQRPGIFNRESGVFLADSSAADSNRVYQTRNGRTVRGGGGITPDLLVSEDSLNAFQVALLMKSMLFNFAVEYATRHPELPRNFVVDDDLIEEFRLFLEKNKFDYKVEGEEALDQFRQTAEKAGFLSSLQPGLQQIDLVLRQLKAKEFEASRAFIREELQREIAAKLWGTRGAVEATFDDDQALQRAVEILRNEATYTSILKGSTKTARR
ncbi:MAG: S41 family peptidase [candidate division KSB1 bacterium]|nr:S41 family peptidase [candidate division KSB1 bacterium]